MNSAYYRTEYCSAIVILVLLVDYMFRFRSFLGKKAGEAIREFSELEKRGELRSNFLIWELSMVNISIFTFKAN